MLWTTNDEALSTQATKDKKNKTTSIGADSWIGESIKNQSIVANLAKKSKLTKLKRAGLLNIKANSRTDFLILRAKKAFTHLQKAFTKAPILKYFDPEHYI